MSPSRTESRKGIFISAVFAAIGVGAGLWVVGAPMFRAWLRTADRTREVPVAAPEVVSTPLDPPSYGTPVTADNVADVVEQVGDALAARWSADSALHALGASAKEAILAEYRSDLHRYLTGSFEMWEEWHERTGANRWHNFDDTPGREEAQQFWEARIRNYRFQPIDIERSTIRVRYVDGRGPLPYPDDAAAYGVQNLRADFPLFDDLPLDAERGRLTIVEAVTPVFYVDAERGEPHQVMVGRWYARTPGDSRWRIWRLQIYDFTQPKGVVVFPPF